jgi:hypothetical protein
MPNIVDQYWDSGREAREGEYVDTPDASTTRALTGITDRCFGPLEDSHVPPLPVISLFSGAGGLNLAVDRTPPTEVASLLILKLNPSRRSEQTLNPRPIWRIS